MHSPLRLAEIVENDPPERLIEIIQNCAGNIPKEEREAALVELIRRFQFLIKKVCGTLYYGYDLGKKYQYDYQDFFQDVLTEFIDLVVSDFKVKMDRNDTGLAVFGSYIKVKLYRRVQYKMQERLRKAGYESVKLVDFQTIGGNSRTEYGPTSSFETEVRQSIVANALHYDDVVLNHITDTECGKILGELIAIADLILPARERKVWELYYLSGIMVGEIGDQIASKIKGSENKTIGRSRVLQIARDANDQIIREFGRRSALNRSAII